MCPQNVKVSMGKKRRSPAQLAAVAGGREKAAANAAARRAAAAEPESEAEDELFDVPLAPVPVVAAGARSPPPDHIHEMFESEPALWDYFVAGAPAIVSDNVAQAI